MTGVVAYAYRPRVCSFPQQAEWEREKGARRSFVVVGVRYVRVPATHFLFPLLLLLLAHPTSLVIHSLTRRLRIKRTRVCVRGAFFFPFFPSPFLHHFSLPFPLPPSLSPSFLYLHLNVGLLVSTHLSYSSSTSVLSSPSSSPSLLLRALGAKDLFLPITH